MSHTYLDKVVATCFNYAVPKGFDLISTISHIACNAAKDLSKISWLKKYQEFFRPAIFFMFYQLLIYIKKTGMMYQKNILYLWR